MKEVDIMISYQNVLFGYDGSPQSMIAFDRAQQIAKRNNTKLIIAMVVKPQYVNTESVALGFGVIQADGDNKKALEQKAKELSRLKQVAESEGGVKEVETRLVIGNPRDELTYNLPKEEHVGLIIIGSTGLGRVAQVLIGSTASYIVEHANVDVIVIKEQKSELDV
ncbi:universal stress protein UspA-like nucleotide-binding protein [Pediococcus argentinicus]|uniref:Universal stress protein UspA-like nucleotide-binding protein n=2 Tax=Pediococcus argentinicus TaxID=480391 RepID=A0A0R2NP56_9LACO|nr:universal stress protein UspA-like nucleotide-binding protein [Pediococcus argentinicus]